MMQAQNGGSGKIERHAMRVSDGGRMVILMLDRELRMNEDKE